MKDQHDDHCWLVAFGDPVKITWMQGIGRVTVLVWSFYHDDWLGLMDLDLSKVDWLAYHAAYRRRMGEVYPEDVEL